MFLFVVQDDILLPPALHVSMGSTCRHISTFPPASGSCDMLSSRCLLSAISITFGFLAPDRKDASTVLPECPFPFVFRMALHQIAQPLSGYSTFRFSSLSLALRFSHSVTLLPCCGPQKGLEVHPALSKDGDVVIADPPTITLASLMDFSAL